MKNEAVNHTKMSLLMRRTGLPRWGSAGILELLWKLAAREAPCGDIGKLSNEEIAAGIDWREDPDALIDALSQARWLEPHPKFRIVIHDWWEHAEDNVHSKVARARLYFACGKAPKLTGLRKLEKTAVESFYRAAPVAPWATEAKSGIPTTAQPVALGLTTPERPITKPYQPSQAKPQTCASENLDALLDGMTAREYVDLPVVPSSEPESHVTEQFSLAAPTVDIDCKRTPASKINSKTDLRKMQEQWFEVEFWPLRWRSESKKAALDSFCKIANSEKIKNQVVASVKSQRNAMLEREQDRRPYMATWLNQRRFEDVMEVISPIGPVPVRAIDHRQFANGRSMPSPRPSLAHQPYVDPLAGLEADEKTTETKH